MNRAVFLLPGLLFAQGTWKVPQPFAAAGYRRETLPEGVRLSGPGPAGALTETLDAKPYRGLPVRLRATIRVEQGARAQLQLRIDRPGGVLGFFDNMGDRPITSTEWKTYEVEGEVAPDAVSVEAGVLSSGSDAVWIKDVSLETMAPGPTAVREALRANYVLVDAAYAAGDTAAIAALAVPDAAIVLSGGPLPLTKVLAVMAGRKLHSRSEVTAVLVDGPEATVWVNNESAGAAEAVFSTSRDVWVETDGGWKLKRSTLIATRPATPQEVLADIPSRAAWPKWQGVRIIVCDCRSALSIPGFPAVSAEVDARAAGDRAVAYLKEYAPEEAGPAALALQDTDAARLAATVRAFDRHRASTPAWLNARHDALIAYQAATGWNGEKLAAHIIWLASEAHPDEKFLVVAPPAVLPALRLRYGKQVYAIGGIPRELLGGGYFIDIAAVPPGTPLGRWLAAQKFPFDGLVGE